MTDMNDRKPIIWFLLIAFGFSWALFVVPLAFGAPGSNRHGTALIVAFSLAMWGPGLGALVATRYAAREPLSTLNLGRLGPRRTYLWAWLVPPALAILTGVLTWALGVGKIDTTFPAIREAMEGAPRSEAVSPGMVVAIQFIASVTLAPLFNTLLALGEELGWRGFLLPRLLPLGQWPAILISGAIWGLWHAPAILQGHNYPGQPVLGILMMTVFTVLVGAIFSWLYLRTESPWAPALAHGSLNATAGLPIYFMPDVDIVLGGMLTSVVGWIAVALFVGWLVLSKRLPVRAAPAA